MNKQTDRIEALVLDWAGTTVDYGSRAPALVFQKVFESRGVPISLEQAREPMGMAKKEHIATIAQMPSVADAWVAQHGRACGEVDVDRMYEEFLPLQKQVLHEYSEVIPGVTETVDRCRQHGLAIGSSTGYTRELMEIVAPAAAAQGYSPDFYLTAEDAPRGRPAPFLLFEAAKRTGVFPMWRILKVDDTTVGIEAGINANCWTVGVSQTGNLIGLSEQDFCALPFAAQQERLLQAELKLRQAGAHFVVRSVAELPGVIEHINELIAEGRRPWHSLDAA